MEVRTYERCITVVTSPVAGKTIPTEVSLIFLWKVKLPWTFFKAGESLNDSGGKLKLLSKVS